MTDYDTLNSLLLGSGQSEDVAVLFAVNIPGTDFKVPSHAELDFHL